jgi:hypothetical protein
MDVPPMSDALATVTVAFIGTVVAAVSWLGKSAISGLVWYYGRRARELELVVALSAEINTAIDALAEYAEKDSAAIIIEGLSRDPDYRIFIPLDRDYFIFERVKADISSLPEAAILPVVRFYDEIGGFDVLVSEFQAPRFEAFPADRRKIYVAYIPETADSVVTAGRDALATLDLERAALRARQRTAAIAIGGLMFLIVVGILAALGLATFIYVY